MGRRLPLNLEIQAVEKDAIRKGCRRRIALHIVPHDTALRCTPKLAYVRTNNRCERLGGPRQHVGDTIHDTDFCGADYLLGKGLVVRVGNKLDLAVGCPHSAIAPLLRCHCYCCADAAHSRIIPHPSSGKQRAGQYGSTRTGAATSAQYCRVCCIVKTNRASLLDLSQSLVYLTALEHAQMTIACLTIALQAEMYLSCPGIMAFYKADLPCKRL